MYLEILILWIKCFAVSLLLLLNPLLSQAETLPEDLYLMIIDSQKGEPYQSVRENVLNHLKESGKSRQINLSLKHYSIGNYPDAVKNILTLERKNHYHAVLVNGTMALMGAKKYGMGQRRYNFIFGAVTDPVGIGVIDGFNIPPKSNFTGVAYPVDVNKRLRFIQKWLPWAKKIGLIHSDMPQSHSYNRWLSSALKQEEFKGLELITRQVPFVPSEGGHIRMARLAQAHIQELNPIVDLFISPNDQMGVQQPFVEAMARKGNKPLVGLSKAGVTKGWGAALSIYPSMKNAGQIAGQMILDLYDGKDISTLYPRFPSHGRAFNKALARRFGIGLPHWPSSGNPPGALVFE